MIDDLRLATIGAFVATGLAIVSGLLLLVLCIIAAGAPDESLAERMILVYLMGTITGLALFYARWEYRNLREAREAQAS